MGSVAVAVLPFVANAGLMVGSPVDSVFNNGRSQINLASGQTGGAFQFINALKGAQNWVLGDSSGVPAPDTLNAQGYPISISNGGVYTILFIPLAADRPGNWRLTWEGTGTVTAAGGGGLDTDGDFTFAPVENVENGSNRVVLRIETGTNLSNIQFFHEDDEARLNAGEIFTTRFLDSLRLGRWGVIRFMDWALNNITNVRYWADRKPVDYVYWWGQEARSSIYAGATTNSGDDYSCSAPSNWDGLVDKAIVTVRFNTSASGVTPTLNVAGTGAKIIRDYSGEELHVNLKPASGRYGTLVYSTTLDCWLKFGGDAIQDFDGFINNGVPIEVMVELCREIGAHPWFCPPYLSCDPITDYTTGLATYVRDNGDPWMVPRFEACPNETWNTASDFYATRYANAMANAHWGVANYQQWVGKVASTQGQAISAVYGDDRSKYWCVLGIQTHGSTVASDPRLTSEDYVEEDGGEPAYDWVTHICAANYYTPTYTEGEASAAATAYAAADPAGKIVIATAYAESVLVDEGGDQYRFSIPRLVNSLIPAWQTWAEGYGVMGFTFYEGGYSADYTGDAQLNALKKGSKAVTELDGITLDLYDDLDGLGCEFPSHLSFSGPNNVWSLWDPTVYDDPSPQVYGIAEFNSN